MTVEHCIKTDGSRCTSCCRPMALNTKVSTFHKIRRGEVDSNVSPANLKRISKRRAKKKNPYMYQTFKGSNVVFAHCAYAGPDGCSVHESRPTLCSGYPGYGHGKADQPEYDPDCTYWLTTE